MLACNLSGSSLPMKLMTDILIILVVPQYRALKAPAGRGQRNRRLGQFLYNDINGTMLPGDHDVVPFDELIVRGLAISRPADCNPRWPVLRSC